MFFFEQRLGADEHNTYVINKTCEVGNNPAFQAQNRYSNIVPYDDKRVVLSGPFTESYINASHVCGYDRDGNPTPNAYIAAQAPLEGTTCDFYRMILEQGVSTIVMLTRVVEGGVLKSFRYWPKFAEVMLRNNDGKLIKAVMRDPEDVRNSLGTSIVPDDESTHDVPKMMDGVLVCKSVTVRPILETIEPFYIKREMEVISRSVCIASVLAFTLFVINAFTHWLLLLLLLLLWTQNPDIKQRVTQIQYKNWPDHGVPLNTQEIRVLVNVVEDLRKDDSNPARPIVVHCSAGVGRTGSFCVIHTIMQQIHRAMKTPGFDPSQFMVNLPKIVMMFRSCRCNMIQQVNQYVFCYRAICDEARALSLIPGLLPSFSLHNSIGFFLHILFTHATGEETPTTTESETAGVDDSAHFFTEMPSGEEDRPLRERGDAVRDFVSQNLFPKQEGGVPTAQTQHRQLRESRLLARSMARSSLSRSRAPMPLPDACTALQASQTPLSESQNPLRESRASQSRGWKAFRPPPKRLGQSKSVEVIQ